MFNLGVQEILILVVGCLCVGGVVVGVVLLVTFLTRRQGPGADPTRLAALEEENRRLREELDRLRYDRA